MEAEEIKEVNSEEVKELTPEEKEMNDKFMRSIVIGKFRTTLQDIYSYMKKKKVSLEEIKQEVENKTSNLTASRREFIIGFKLDFIQQLLDDMYKSKE